MPALALMVLFDTVAKAVADKVTDGSVIVETFMVTMRERFSSLFDEATVRALATSFVTMQLNMLASMSR